METAWKDVSLPIPPLTLSLYLSLDPVNTLPGMKMSVPISIVFNRNDITIYQQAHLIHSLPFPAPLLRNKLKSRRGNIRPFEIARHDTFRSMLRGCNRLLALWKIFHTNGSRKAPLPGKGKGNPWHHSSLIAIRVIHLSDHPTSEDLKKKSTGGVVRTKERREEKDP